VRILFDHNVPKKLRSLLTDHFISTSREMGWDTLTNGDLMTVAEDSGFEGMVTGDKNISYQQNLDGRKLALVVLPTTDWGRCGRTRPRSLQRWMRRRLEVFRRWSLKCPHAALNVDPASSFDKHRREVRAQGTAPGNGAYLFVKACRIVAE
jgi:hypothetical protein